MDPNLKELIDCEKMLVKICNGFDPSVATTAIVSVIVNSFVYHHKSKEEFVHVLTQAWDFYFKQYAEDCAEEKGEVKKCPSRRMNMMKRARKL